MSLPPAQNLVLSEDVLVGAEGYIRTSEMSPGLTRHIHLTDLSKGMIQFLSTGFVPALHRTTTGRDLAVLGRNPFHVGGDGQEVVPPVVIVFGAAVGDAAGRVNGRSDLTRMDRVGEDRGADVDWAHAVCVHAGGRTDLLGRRELGVRS